MDWVIVAGVLSLGIILGWMGYVVFTKQSNLKAFIAIVGLFSGAVVAGIFQAIAGTKAALPREVWIYPVGLLAGIGFAFASEIVSVWFLGFFAGRESESIEQRERTKNLIVAHIKNKLDDNGQHVNMIAFDTLRTDLGRPNLTDHIVGEIIAHYSNVLCHRTLIPNRRGVGLVDEQTR
jgi:hypothetical protein